MTGSSVKLTPKSPSNPLVNRLSMTKEYAILEKDGLPVVALMDNDEFEDYLEAKDLSVKRQIAASAREHAEGKGRPAEEFFAELEVEESASHSGIKWRREDLYR